jgi:peptidyl-prolyl cis-trans isomerase C
MTRLITAALIAAALLVSACSRTIVAEVDGYKITSDDVETSIAIERQKYDPIVLKTQANAAAFKRAVLDSLIQEAILLNAARNEGITVSNDELKAKLEGLSEPAMVEKSAVPADEWKERQRRRLVIGKLIEKDVAEKVPVTDDEIQKYYREHKEEFHQPAQYHARQIVVDNKELASKIDERLKKGEDFAKLAEEFSLSPDRKRGGDLGFFNAATFPPIFSEICEKLKPGERSGVVATDYGFQIFELVEKRQPRQLTLDEAKQEIESVLKEKRVEQAFDEWFKARRDKAKVTIYEKELEKINV